MVVNAVRCELVSDCQLRLKISHFCRSKISHFEGAVVPPVRGEPQELLVQHQAAAGPAVVGQHHGAHLVEQQLLRNPAEPVEGALQTFHQDRHGLPSIELQPQQPGRSRGRSPGHGAGPRAA